MKNIQNTGAFVRQTSQPKIQHQAVQVIVVISPVADFNLFKIKSYIAKADLQTLRWFLAELKDKKHKTLAQ